MKKSLHLLLAMLLSTIASLFCWGSDAQASTRAFAPDAASSTEQQAEITLTYDLPIGSQISLTLHNPNSHSSHITIEGAVPIQGRKGIYELKEGHVIVKGIVGQIYTRQLKSFQAKNASSLTDLVLYSDKGLQVDLSECRNLQTLTLNRLQSLDLSHNPALRDLTISSSPLSSIDLSQNKALQELSIWSTKLETLNLSQNKALQSLSLSNSNLTSLDLSQNDALLALIIRQEKIASIDFSQNKKLLALDLHDLQLQKLDVSHCPHCKCFSVMVTNLPILTYPTILICTTSTFITTT